MPALSLGISLRIILCIAISVAFAYAYIEKQNELTGLRLKIPIEAKELKAIQEINVKIKYDIDSFESPSNLIHLIKKPEFSHLKFQGRDVTTEMNSRAKHERKGES